MPTHPLVRAFLLMVLIVGGIVAVGYGVKHDNPYTFVPGLVSAVFGVLYFADFGRKPNR